MITSIIQLHVAPDEFAKFIGGVAKDLHLHAVLLRFSPNFSCEHVPDPLKLTEIMDLMDGNEVVLLVNEPQLDARDQLQFYDRNLGCISFVFGRWLPTGLRQSSMGYKSEDEATIAAGKEISKRLKKVSKTGVLIVNPKTGDSAISKTYRYTAGALALEKSGVQMLPIGGNLARLEGRYDDDKRQL